MPSTHKIAIIGAGSHVFSLGLLSDLILDGRLNDCKLALMDLDVEMAEIMAGIARRMAAEAGTALEITATDDRAAALDGADFVTTSVAVQLLRRYHTDREVLRKHGIREILAENGGVGGLSYTLRQVALLLDIARDMERRCSRAWLFNASNPLPRVITAITRHTRIRAAGFCNVAWGGEHGYGNIARLLNRDMRELDVVTAGLNHFSWLISARDRRSGEDLLPAVNAAMAAGGTYDGPLVRKFWRQFGVLPMSGDTHVAEFLPFDPEDGREEIAHHGTDAERAAHRQMLADAAAGRASWQPLLAHGRSWEHPGEVIAAMIHGKRLHLDMINIPNHGAIIDLPDDAVVEVPAEVHDGEIVPRAIGLLPAGIADICARVSATHTLAAEAAAAGDRALLAQVIESDPAITDKAAAGLAIDELLQLHADVLPQFAVSA